MWCNWWRQKKTVNTQLCGRISIDYYCIECEWFDLCVSRLMSKLCIKLCHIECFTEWRGWVTRERQNKQREREKKEAIESEGRRFSFHIKLNDCVSLKSESYFHILNIFICRECVNNGKIRALNVCEFDHPSMRARLSFANNRIIGCSVTSSIKMMEKWFWMAAHCWSFMRSTKNKWKQKVLQWPQDWIQFSKSEQNNMRWWINNETWAFAWIHDNNSDKMWTRAYFSRQKHSREDCILRNVE